MPDSRRFVIQKHDASSLHYDLRLEDHPLDYADFEGVIRSGYGAGTVIVWDRGTWRSLAGDDGGGEVALTEQLEGGHAKFWLEGEKLRGGYALQRIAKGGDERWLLIKMDDEGADARRNPVSTEPESVKSGRTIEEVAREEGDAAGDGAGG